ncbi:hypothetical protein DFS33DRAFT_1243919, partial [Desarmillaria ectypa]
ITAFLDDFLNALTRAEALDETILSDASSISTEYTDVVSLAARHIEASTEMTVPETSAG